MSPHLRTCTSISIACLLVVPQALGKDLAPLKAAELQASCRLYVQAIESAEARVCAAYVRGYIEGSPAVIFRHQAIDETFTGRALRTRYGGNTGRPRFCLRNSVTVGELAGQIVVQAESHPPKSQHLAGDLIEATLTRFHRCSTDRNLDEAVTE